MASTLLERLEALKAAHANHKEIHPLRLRLSDRDAIALVNQIHPREGQDEQGNPTPAPAADPKLSELELRDVGTQADGKPKPTLQEAANQLEEFLDKTPFPDATTAPHAEIAAWMERKQKLHQALWDHLEGLTIDNVELIEER